MASSGMLHRVGLVITDVSQDHSTSIIRVTRIGELGTTLTVTSNRGTRRLLQEPHGVTYKKTPFIIVTAVETSNLTSFKLTKVCHVYKGKAAP
jgi:hypothetical protein